MKLSSLKCGRDGQLVVVSRDFTRCVAVPDIATTLQAALDCWAQAEPRLQAVYAQLNDASLEGETFEIERCDSPLPRAYQWADGSAYVNHVELVRKARGAEMPESFWTDPLMYQGGSDDFLAPSDPIIMRSEEWGIDFEAEIAVITDDVASGVTAVDAADHIKLLTLVNDVSLRNLIPTELAKGFGFFHAKPSSAFSPIAVTPDELGDPWCDGKLHLPLLSYLNGDLFGKPNAGIDMTFSFAELVAHAAKTRNLCAGTIIGSGTVSNKLDGGPGRPVKDGGAGYSCIAEMRMVEILLEGKPRTKFMKFGDHIKIEMLDLSGNTVFGAIEQTVVRG